MKKLIAILLLLATLLTLFACTPGEIIGPSGGGGGQGGGSGEGGDDYTPPEMNDDPTDDFTVTLLADGQPYSPRMEMYAHFSDGFSMFRSKFDSSGVARIDGLDGDYRVTLSAVPNEYTYDPNTNIVTNDARNITVELHSLTVLTGTGTDSYSGHSIGKTGVYTATLKSADEGVFFMFSPTENGIYTIESWADVTADNVNPYCDVYIGTFAWNQYQRTIDDGGSVGSYTTNFKHDVRLSEDMVGNNYIFAVKADSRTNTYPVVVTFAVKRDGGFDRVESGNTASGGLKAPDHDFRDFDKSAHEYGDGYTIKDPEYLLSGNTYVFDERRFKVWDKSDGGDGFYHVYDKEKYPETDGFGPILYAYITENSRFIDRPFYKIEYSGTNMINNALKAGKYNYKALIEGVPYLTERGNITMNGEAVGYFCGYDCPCHEGYTGNVGFACVATRNEDGQLVKCPNCAKSCEPCPEELFDYFNLFTEGGEPVAASTASIKIKSGKLISLTYGGVTYSLTLKEKGEEDKAHLAGAYTAASGNTSFDVRISDTGIAFTVGGETVSYTYKLGFMGYAYYANSDGLVPVTPELRDFLYAYNDKQKFFNDGTGNLETTGLGGKLYQSVGESGWLFACAYYEEQ